MFFDFSALYAADNAIYYVNQGLEFYQAKDYESALYAFARAEEFAPEDFRILYNQACTLLKSGQKNEAISLFRKTAFAKDQNIAFESLMSLGNIAVDQALAILEQQSQRQLQRQLSQQLLEQQLPNRNQPDQPDQQQSSDQQLQIALDSVLLPTSLQRRVLEELTTAEKEFSEAMSLLKERKKTEKFKTAKHNLEMVRLWKKQLLDSWKEKQWKRDLSLLSNLIEIENAQKKLRQNVLSIATVNDSPKKFQILYMGSKEQTQIRENVVELQKKLLENPKKLQELLRIDENELEQRIKKICEIVEEYALYSNSASKHLLRYDSESALQFQDAALEMLDSMHNQFRSYEQLVRTAEELQSKLCSEIELQSFEEEHEESPYFRREISRQARYVFRWTLLFVENAKTDVKTIENLSLIPYLAELNEIFEQPLSSNEEIEEMFETDAFREIQESDEELLFKSMKLAIDRGQKIESLLKYVLRNLERDVNRKLTIEQYKRISSYMTQVKMLLREILEPLDEKMEKEIDGTSEDMNNQDDFWKEPNEFRNFQQNEEPNNEENEKSGNSSDGDSSNGSDDTEKDANQSDDDKNQAADSQKDEALTQTSEKPPNDRDLQNVAQTGQREGDKTQAFTTKHDTSSSDWSDELKDQSQESETGENDEEKTTIALKERNDPKFSEQKALIDSLNERDRTAWEKMSASEKEIFIFQRKQGQEQAEALIRSVKRRQREANKFRNQIRLLLETSGNRNIKDW